MLGWGPSSLWPAWEEPPRRATTSSALAGVSLMPAVVERSRVVVPEPAATILVLQVGSV